MFHVTLCHDASASLEPQLAVAAYEGADGYGLVQTAVHAYIAYASAIGSAAMGLILAYQLHGPHLGCAAPCRQ